MIGAAWAILSGGSATRLAATLLAGVALGGWGAWKVQTWRHGHQQAQQIERSARDLVRQFEQRDRATGAYIKEQTHADRAHAPIAKRVEAISRRPDHAVQCIAADGMHELRAAIATTATPAGIDEAVPGPE